MLWKTCATAPLLFVAQLAAAQPPQPQDDGASAAGTIPVPQPAAPAPEEPEPQPSPSRLIEEIVVTAQRREEILQNVPISISVLSGDALFDRNIVDTNDLAAAVPGLSAMNFFNRNETDYSMRGQGKAFEGSAPGVVPYFNEVPQFTSFLYDFENVQVLKGPQGTLFGKNTTGGAILFTPRRPTSDPDDNFVAVQLGEFGRHDLTFGYGGSLIGEDLMFRIAGQRLRLDGYTKNLYDGERLDDYSRESYRASLLYAPADAFENLMIVQWENANENGTSQSLNAFVDAPTTPYQLQLRQFLEEQRARGPRRVSNDAPLFSLARSWGAINTATWDISPSWTLKNILSYRRYKTSAFYDEDGTHYRIANAGYPRDVPYNRNLTGELQLLYSGERFDVTAGLYAEQIKSPGRVLTAYLTLPIVLVPADFNLYSARHDKSQAAFAQWTWRPLADLDLAFGYRHTRDDRRAASGQELVTLGVPVTILPETPYHKTFSADTWSTSATYRLSDDLTTYAALRRGYKAGGFNTLTTDTTRVTFKPEYLTDLEIGLKAEWELVGWQLRTNMAVYYDDYKDVQRLLTQATVPPTGVTQNAAQATVYGFDLDVLAAPSSLFDATLQYAYVHARYDEYEEDPQYGDLSEGDFPVTPVHQLTFIPSFHIPLSERLGSLHPQATLFYQSEMALYVTNEPNGNFRNDRAVVGSIAPGYTRIDVSMDWRDPWVEGLSVGFFVRNVTDKEIVVGGVNALGIDIVGVNSFIYAPPRMYGFNLKYTF